MPRLAQISIPETRANTGAECSAAGRELQKRAEELSQAGLAEGCGQDEASADGPAYIRRSG